MTSVRPYSFALPVVLTLALAAAAPAGELVTLAGRTIRGDLIGVDAQFVSFKDAATGAVAKIPLKEVSEVRTGGRVAPPGTAKRNEVELTDGSLLLVPDFVLKGKRADITFLPVPGATAPTADLPMTALFHVMRSAEDPKARADWKQVLANRRKRDLFVSRNVKGELEPIEGTFIEADDAGKTVKFQDAVNDEVRNLRQFQASGGFVFNQPSRGVIAPTVCKVRDVFGNVLIAQSVTVTEAGVKVKTVSDATFDYPGGAGIAVLDFGEGNLKYLSDLDPVVSAPDEVPGEPRLTYLKNRTQDGARLRLDGTDYPKGLLVYPDTSLTYTLGGDYREFKAVVGIDDRIPVASSVVRLTIEADGRQIYSAAVSRKEKPKLLSLDVKDVKQLKITVERDSLYVGNQVNLADVRVLK